MTDVVKSSTNTYA